MKIDKEIVEKVAKVARIELTKEEVDHFVPQLKEILTAFSRIDEVDTDKVRMSIQPVEIRNALREDIAKECLTVEEALRNTQHRKDHYFKGPRAV